MVNKRITRYVSLMLIIAASACLSFKGIAQVTNSESFDGDVFVPAGWTDLLVSGTNVWSRVTTGNFPTQSPHSGVGEAKFNSWDVNGGVRALITPAYDLSQVGGNTATISFWMYRDNGYSATADKIDVYMNTAANLTGATLLGTVNRSRSLAPTETADGWYQYTFNVPPAFNGTTNYLVLQGTSAYGNNIYLDDITWISYPPVCSGIPSPGATVSSSATICPSASLSLSLANLLSGSGITYQWQSSTDNVNYANIGGETAMALNTSQTENTWYQCIVTCTNSAQTTTSTPVQVTMNSFMDCYCSLEATSEFDTDIGNVTLANLNNGSAEPVMENPNANGTYSDYSSMTPAELKIGVETPISLSQITSGTSFYDAWFNVFIDYNHDGIFDEVNERVFTSTQLTTSSSATQTGVITVPVSAVTGLTKMRVRLEEFGSNTDVACGTFGYGEVEDYTVNITCPDLTVLEATGASVCANTSAEIVANAITTLGTLTWYDAATSGNVLAINDTLVTGNIATTASFWVEETLQGCPASGRIEVIVTVDPVNVELNPIAAICYGSATGTFQLGAVHCGTPPFTYSVNSGSFGNIPSNLTAGEYTVVVKGAGNQLSAPMTLVIEEPDTMIMEPVGVSSVICVNSESALISATSTLSTDTHAEQVITIDVLTQPSEVNSAPGDTIGMGVMQALPAGAVIEEILFTYNGLESVGSSWQSDVKIGFAGAIQSEATYTDSTNGTQGIFDFDDFIHPDSVVSNGGNIYVLYWDNWDDNTGADETIFPTGSGVATITIKYSYPTPVNVIWWDASTGGNQLSTNDTLEGVGTSVLPDAGLPGVYNFYVQGEHNGCTSIDRTLVTITVESPSDTLAIQACDTYTLPDNQVVTTTGMYHYYIANNTGCDSTIFADVTIFETGFVAEAILANDVELSTTTPGTAYQWIDCATNMPINGATSSSYTAIANGNYAVVVTAGDCGTDTSDCVAVTAVGLADLNLADGITIAPNPVKDDLKINFTEIQAVIELYDLQGKVIFEKAHFKSGEVISMQKLQMGVYILKITTEKGIKEYRIVKN